MKYMGSKNRHSKEILPIILKNRKERQYVYDLMCGGGNICDKIKGNVIASDINYFVIKALKYIRDEVHSIPKDNKEFTEKEYIFIKESLKFSHRDGMQVSEEGLVGYVGFALSYSGKWFGGWSRDKKSKRDYVAESYRNAVKQSPNLQNVEFINSSYDKVELKPNSILYLDPPYKTTTKYKTGGFDYDKFYDWCIEKHKEGHQVFISEYYMPENNFECVWSKQVNSSLTKDTGSKKNIEKLFIVKTQ